MTNQSLISRVEDTEQGNQQEAHSENTSNQNPENTTSVAIEENVDSDKSTNLMSSGGTSNKSDDVDWEKRYKDLQSFQSKRENELRDKIKELEQEDNSFKAPTTKEEMEQFKEKNPDLYNMMLTLAHNTASEATEGISSKIETYEKERRMSEFAKAQARIQETHSDFQEIINSSEFHGWAKEQPSQVQQWIYNNPDDPELAIIALDRYKASRDASTAHPAKENTQQQPGNTGSAADAVSSSSAPEMTGEKKVWSIKEIKSLSRHEWADNEADIMKAYAEGRVVN